MHFVTVISQPVSKPERGRKTNVFVVLMLQHSKNKVIKRLFIINLVMDLNRVVF